MAVTQQALVQNLKKYFGYESFRDKQLETILSIVNNKMDAFVCLATGSGKSIVYQLPATLSPSSLVLVVSPLVSLMQDQTIKLEQCGIAATFLGSSQPDPGVEGNVFRGRYRIVYITPEKLEVWGDELKRLHMTHPITLIAVDESHCISQWGHDFRSSYLKLNTLKTTVPDVPIVALTATATPDVQDDIISRLRLNRKNLFIARTNVDRPNLFYQVCAKETMRMDVELIEAELKRALPKGTSGSAIVYCMTVDETKSVSEALKAKGFKSVFYNAKMSNQEREIVHKQFLRNEVDVICATVAFGMGIDKPDVRLVVHFGPPKSIEQYYQEIGRAGRDGKPSTCVLICNLSDFASRGAFYLQGLSQDARAVASKKLEQMRNYAASSQCRRKILLNYFGDSGVCDQGCDNCVNSGGAAAQQQARDFSDDARLLLKAVSESGNKFGATMPVDILVGSKNKKITENNLMNLPSFGKGRHHNTDWWKNFFWMVHEAGLLESIQKSGSKFSFTCYGVTPKGYKALSSSDKIMLIPSKSLLENEQKHSAVSLAASARVASSSGSTQSKSELLKDGLRKLRMQIANDRQLINPLHIFDDATLDGIIATMPRDRATLEKVPGMNEFKIREYGDKIIAFTSASTAATINLSGRGASLPAEAYQNLDPRLKDPKSIYYLPFPPCPVETLTNAKHEVWERFQLEKMSIRQIFEDPTRQRQESTVAGYLVQAITAGYPLDIHRLGVDEAKWAVDLTGVEDVSPGALRSKFPDWSWEDARTISAVVRLRRAVEQSGSAQDNDAGAPLSTGARKLPASLGGGASVSAQSTSIVNRAGSFPSRPVKHKGNAIVAEDDDDQPAPPARQKSASDVDNYNGTGGENLGALKRKRTELLSGTSDDIQIEMDDVEQPLAKRSKTEEIMPPVADEGIERLLTQLPTTDNMDVDPPRPAPSKIHASVDTVLAFLKGAKMGATRDEIDAIFDGPFDDVLHQLIDDFAIYQNKDKYCSF